MKIKVKRLFLARDNDGSLYAYRKKPVKGVCGWYSVEGWFFRFPEDFIILDIKWEDEEPLELVFG